MIRKLRGISYEVRLREFELITVANVLEIERRSDRSA